MFNKILVALDGTAEASLGLPLAATLAQGRAAELILVQVSGNYHEDSPAYVAAREADCSVVMASLAHGASPYVIGANIPLGASDPADGPQVYFDDMERPVMRAKDKTFTWGRVGLGTFDDHGNFDEFKLRGERVERE